MKFKGILLLMLVAICCQAQTGENSVNGKTIEWQSPAYIDRATNDRIEAPNTFVINGSEIEWNQATAEAKQIFSIKNTENKWTNLDQEGYVKYTFDCYNTQGSLTVQRLQGKLSALLEINGLASGSLTLFFEISQMTY
ncbi:MAG TPA: hypothetical protein PKL56_16860 [Cyclobacteriaceae bacterium]|nr:hypothetical protein [Cyclobacteriaceae bacterium]HMV09298.1 hypothetical protein [Cyclobacteriaceae bacterium]HMX01902.1 hypothetical protein [Cyclobacteriaceae bacterium]HMX50825.1 hypothetical protein [Cyclobacteriaceae bacterium]HMY94725.1 hypothetical protein [Cyclobacteriaceae bacterium]